MPPERKKKNAISKQARLQASNPSSSKQPAARPQASVPSSSKQPAARPQASTPSSSNQPTCSEAKQSPAKQPAPADPIDHNVDWQGETVMEMFPDPDENTEGYNSEELEAYYLGLQHREAFLERCGGQDPTEWFNEQARQAWAEEKDYII